MIAQKIHSTTVLAVKKEEKVAMGGDGQVTINQTVLKASAVKIRTMQEGRVLAGFAGSTADAFTLFGRFEEKLKESSGNLLRAAVELAKDWRTDRMLRRLDALLIVADKSYLFTLSGNGDVIEPDDGIAAIGSGGPFALAAARGLLRHTSLSPREIVSQSLSIASEICIFTNNTLTIQEIS